MLTSKIFSACPIGIEAHLVTVEAYVRHKGIPSFVLVGLPDASIRESKERVMAAIRNAGIQFPAAKITISLAPADIKKEGTEFDLPIAIGILAQEGRIPLERLTAIQSQYLWVGELGLDGILRSVRGTLTIVQCAKANKFKGVIVPDSNKEEAALVDGIEVIACKSLNEVIQWASGNLNLEPYCISSEKVWEKSLSFSLKDRAVDLADIQGNALAKKALEVAAAGGHNLLMVGPPGVGKTLLAKALPGILPPLEKEEALELTKIHSLVEASSRKFVLVRERPFRAVHHSSSGVALIGGGSRALPGEVSLAHRGVLFLDEMGEFPQGVLDLLRQPMEDGEVFVSRAAARFRYPACFMLIGATNPCPCGWRGSKDHDCRCSSYQIFRYQRRLSGPLLDRMDLHIEVSSGEFKKFLLNVSQRNISNPGELDSVSEIEGSMRTRGRVIAARKIQTRRFGNSRLNAQMSIKEIGLYCKIGDSSDQFLLEVMRKYGLSPRAYHRILKVSRTLADLDGNTGISKEHLSLAVTMRALDRINNY